MLDVNGNLCEGQGSNIFLVKDGALFTPREQYVLAGISRAVVIELAQEIGVEVGEADVDLYDAYTADEAFVTSTSFCICQVSTINGAAVGNGAVPGPVTDRLQKAYSGLVGIDVVGAVFVTAALSGAVMVRIGIGRILAINPDNPLIQRILILTRLC